MRGGAARHSSVALALALTLTSATLLADGEAWAATPTSWIGTPAPIPLASSSGSFNFIQGVSCPSAGSCVAVGTYRDPSATEVGLIDTLSGGSWTPEEAPMPVGAVQLTLDAVSCVGVGACVAVGTDRDASYDGFGVIETLADGTWSVVQVPLPANPPSGLLQAFFTAVSCPAANACVALGEVSQPDNNVDTTLFTDTESDGVWAVASAPIPSAAASYQYDEWGDLSCPSVGTCVAVGQAANPVACVITCTTALPVVDVLSANSWTLASTPLPSDANTSDPNEHLSAVSCSSTSSCSAVGSYVDQAGLSQGLLESLSGGVWSPGTAPLPSGATSAGLSSVACPADGWCVAVGGYTEPGFDVALVDVSSGGSWTTATAAPPVGSTQSDLQGVTCTGVGSCEAVGSFIDAAGEGQALLENLAEGSWTASAPPLPANASTTFGGAGQQPSSWLDAVSCPDLSSCVAIGTYSALVPGTSEEDTRVGLLETQAAALQSSTSLSASSDAPTYDQPVTLTATVMTTDGGGSVAFSSNGAPIPGCTAQPLNSNLSDFEAICLTSALDASTDVITADYGGDALITGSDAAGVTLFVGATDPGAPTSVVAIPANGSATVSWTAPSSDGGSPITAFTVTAAPGGDTCTWSTGPLSCAVTGLTNGTTYTFTVAATNTVGTGTASTASTPVTPATIPGAPTSVTATPAHGSATVAWSAPSSDGGSPVTGYTVAAAPGDRTCTTTAKKCEVTGLSPMTQYRFTVVAQNAVGRGAPTASQGVYPFLPHGLGVEVLTSILSKGERLAIVAGGASPGARVTLTMSGAASVACVADQAGQCRVTMVETGNGALTLYAASGAARSSMAAYAPLVKGPATLKHGGTATITVTFCPRGAKVTLSLSDHRTFRATAAASGTVTFHVKMPTAGRVTFQTIVDGTTLVPDDVLIAT